MLPSSVIPFALLLSLALLPCPCTPDEEVFSGSGTASAQYENLENTTEIPSEDDNLENSTETTLSELVTVKTTVPYAYMTMPPAAADDPWQTAASVTAVAKKLHATSLGPITEHTVNALLSAYERLLDLSTEETADKTTARQIVEDTTAILVHLASKTFPTQARSSRFVVQIVRHTSFDVDHGPLQNFHGESVFRSGTLQVSTMCIVSSVQHAGFVIYPADVSMLRAPPTNQHGQVVAFRAVDLVLMPLVNLDDRHIQTCPASVYLDMLLLTWSAPNVGPNARYACAAWTRGHWSNDDCMASRDLARTRLVTCYCDTKGNAAYTAIVIYVYLEDVARGLRYTPFDGTVWNSSDAVEMHACVEEAVKLAENASTSASLEALVTGPLTRLALADLWLSPNDVVLMLDAISEVLTYVKPVDGDHVIGRGSGVVSGVVFSMDFYRHDPISAYIFYKDAASWIGYARLHDVFNWDVLFHESNAFVIMFSATMMYQNVRYGFVLFPVDRYLTPISVIDGHPVVASRVIDFMFGKQHDLNDQRDQFVHLLFNPTTNGRASLNHGCAYWSGRSNMWSTKDCHMDEAIYRHVCTCNLTAGFNESRSRGQYVGFVYEERVEVVHGAVEGEAGIEFVDLALFALHALRKYGDGDRTVAKALDLLSQVFVSSDGSLKLNDEVKSRVIAESRHLLASNACKPRKVSAIAETFGVLCFDSSHDDADYPVVSLAFTRGISENVVTQRNSTFDAEEMVNNQTVFSVAVSQSVTELNQRYAILVYPTDVSLHNPPTMNQQVLSLRVIDIVLVPHPLDESGTDQTLLMYLDQVPYNATQSCASWSDEWQAWTEIGCFGFTLGSRTVCNCSLSKPFAEHSGGGQFVAFTYSDYYFDDTALRGLATPGPTVDADATFAVASALVRNASMLPAHDELVFKTLQASMHVLTLTEVFLSSHGPHVKTLLADLSAMFARYRTDTRRSVFHSFGIVLDAVVELTDNAVEEPSRVVGAGQSFVLMAAVGYYKGDAARRPAGLFYLRGDEEQVFLVHGDPAAILSQPRLSLACLLPSDDTSRYYRLVFVVYPINTSPLPPPMTSHPVFSVRQLDVHVDTTNPYSPTLQVRRPDHAPLDVHYHPTASHENFVSLGCASWDDAVDAWTNALCTLNASTAANVFCRCDVGRQSVTRVAVYEYTITERFAFKDELEVSSVVFLAFGSASLIGLLGIIVTAIGFPEWRAHFSNAAMTQLAVACIVHLALASYRETHLIFAARNLSNISMVVFNAFLHYARLAHYTCALVASALYGRASSDNPGSRWLLAVVALPAWGVALVAVVVLLSWNSEEHFCTPMPIAHYVLFVVPGVVVILFCVAIAAAAWKREDEDGTTAFKATAVVGVMFGVPALIEMFNGFWVKCVALNVVYKVIDAGQGLALFLVFVVFDGKVRGWWATKVFGKDLKVVKCQDTQIEMTGLRGKGD